MGTLNSHRQTSTPTRAMSAATTAVANPPGHSWPGSTFGCNRVCLPSGVVGAVMENSPACSWATRASCGACPVQLISTLPSKPRASNRSPEWITLVSWSRSLFSLPIALATLGFYIAYRLAEDYLIVPRIMGRTVEVSAVVTVVAEVAFRRLDSS
jgi:hypothetical protein